MTAEGAVERAKGAAAALSASLARVGCAFPTVDAYPEPVGPGGEAMVRIGLVPAATATKLARFIDEHAP
ncbi:hypothetical protein ACFVFS_34650 [Kitasatospora sp. NPDC057692]|uniref:hypothetical protein n=1 Tax=Kitasatospora sp. NPDC057692 TaxID=3346215 RepID=UPI0036BC6D6A